MRVGIDEYWLTGDESRTECVKTPGGYDFGGS